MYFSLGHCAGLHHRALIQNVVSSAFVNYRDKCPVCCPDSAAKPVNDIVVDIGENEDYVDSANFDDDD